MEDTKRWHPADEFLKPFKRICEEFCSADVPTPQQAAAIYLFKQSDTYLAGVMWLELNKTPEFSNRFCQRVDDCVNEVEHWRSSFRRVYFCEKSGEPKWSDCEITLPERFSESADLEVVQVEVADLMVYLIWLSNALRRHVHFDKLEFEPPFVPTENQREILAVLNHKSMAQLEMMTKLNIGSKETFSGKGGKGGMKELLGLGLVKNDKRKGGYYRPDLVPT